MKNIFKYQITKNDHHKKIEDFLKQQGYSHNLIVQLRNEPFGIRTRLPHPSKNPNILTDGDEVHGYRAYTTHQLVEGDTLIITLPEEESSEHIVPTNLPFSVLYEDQDLLVVNKAADMPIHPSQGNFDNTLANAAAFYFAQKGEPFIYRAINRLDRDTTGLLILAKHSLSACILADLVKSRQIKRTYLAAVTGMLPESGTITAKIARADGSTIERCVADHGDTACTHYKRLYYDNASNLSLAAIRLETGRTHQIRVHMKHLGHPLPGDFLYNPDYRYFKRQSLHSWKLDFMHPITKEQLHFTAPMPDDFKKVFPDLDDYMIRNPFG